MAERNETSRRPKTLSCLQGKGERARKQPPFPLPLGKRMIPYGGRTRNFDASPGGRSVLNVKKCCGPRYLVVIRAFWAKLDGGATWAFRAILFGSLKKEEGLARANSSPNLSVALHNRCPFSPF